MAPRKISHDLRGLLSVSVGQGGSQRLSGELRLSWAQLCIWPELGSCSSRTALCAQASSSYLCIPELASVLNTMSLLTLVPVPGTYSLPFLLAQFQLVFTLQLSCHPWRKLAWHRASVFTTSLGVIILYCNSLLMRSFSPPSNPLTSSHSSLHPHFGLSIGNVFYSFWSLRT